MGANHAVNPFLALSGTSNEGCAAGITGRLKGQRGFFSRDENGAITRVDLAGRLFNRVS